MSTKITNPGARRPMSHLPAVEGTRSTTAKPSAVRDVNRSIILNLIRLHQPISRAALSDRTGIFRSNVSDIVEDLVSKGLIREARAKPQGRGRVPTLLSLNDEGFLVIGLNVRPRLTTVALAGLAGETQAVATFSTPSKPPAFLREVVAAVEGLRRLSGLRSVQEIRQIGVSMPGLVKTDTGEVHWIPRLPGFSGFAMAKELERLLGIPAAVENDCNLGALAEFCLSEIEGERLRDCVFLEVGDEGVGGGIILNRELYRGCDHTLSAEFGHLIVDPQGRACACGRTGCLELYVSDRSTFERYQPGVHFTAARFQQLLAGVSAHEPRAVATVEATARYLAIGISNIAVVLNPAVLILAGQICKVWPSISRPLTSAFAASSPDVRIRPAHLPAEDLFLRGAIHLALSSVFARPKLGW